MNLNKKIRCPSQRVQYKKGPFPWDAAAGFAGSLIGGFASAAATKDTNRTNLQIAREQNQFNYEQWMRERDYNDVMWNKQNEYNTPKAQYERYVDAGINPYFAMSNIQSGQAQSLVAPQGKPAAGATMQAPDYSFIGNAIPQAVQVAQGVAQLKGQQLDNQIAGIDVQYHQQKVIHGLANLAESTRKIREETVGKRLSNKYQEMVNDFYDRTQKTMEYRMKLENQQIEKNMQAVDFDMAYKYSIQQLQYMQFYQSKAESDARIWSIKENVAQGWAHYALSKQMTNAEIGYKAALIGNLAEQNKVIKATAEGIDLDNKGKRIHLKYQTINEVADLLQKGAGIFNTLADTDQKKAAAEKMIIESGILSSKDARAAVGILGGLVVGTVAGVATANPAIGLGVGSFIAGAASY